MPQWIVFSEDYDFRWPSGAVTAFKEGMKVNVKDEVAKAAFADKVASKTDKPKDGDEARVSTPSRMEGKRPSRRAVRTVKAGGTPHSKPGNPLPDASDPRAKRSEPLVEGAAGHKNALAGYEAANADKEQGHEGIPAGEGPGEAKPE